MKKEPVRWSVASGRGVTWRTALPETGQSGVTVAKGRVFLTSMKPLTDARARREGSDIVGYCIDAHTGKMLWEVEIAGSEPSPYAYGFSDCTSPTPVTDGRRVWFVNSGGKIVCCDAQTGKILWQRSWKPTTGRPFNKQFEPILYKNVLLNVEPRPEGDPKREADPWNWLVALDATTGKLLWTGEDALTHYNTPTLGTLPGGDVGVLLGRGGHHDVPEKPIGASWIRLKDGKRVWQVVLPGKALYNMAQTEKLAFWLDEDHGTHTVLDKFTGKVLAVQNLAQNADVRRWENGKYVFEPNVDLKTRNVRVFPAWFSNIAIGEWHWFLCFSQTGNEYGVGPCGPLHSVGRVNVKTGKTEYLEVPTAPGVYNTSVAASTINSRGIDAANEDRSKRDGWFWNFDASPICLGGRIYWTLMNGVTYVVDSTAKTLDERAILSVNDLGKPGDAWCLSAPGFDGKSLYYRTMRELVRINSSLAS